MQRLRFTHACLGFANGLASLNVVVMRFAPTAMLDCSLFSITQSTQMADDVSLMCV